MSPQHDYIIDNSTGANVRSDINSVLQAIASNNSGSSAPSTTVASQFFADTNAGIMKLRNTSNNGFVNLFTLAGGIDVDAASNFNEDVTFTGASANIVFDKSDNQLEFADNAKAEFGTGGDLEIYHDGSNSILFNNTGQLALRGNEIRLTAKNTENYFVGTLNGASELYYDNNKKLETASYGAVTTGTFQATGNIEVFDNGMFIAGTGADLQIYHDSANNNIKGTGNHIMRFWTNNTIRWNILNDGHFRPEANNSYDIGASNQRVRTVFASNALDMADNAKVQLGDSDDLQIYHDGGDNHIDSPSNAHKLKIQAEANIELRRAGANEVMAAFSPNGAVELYYDNAKKFETTSTGIQTVERIRMTHNGTGVNSRQVEFETIGNTSTHTFTATGGHGGGTVTVVGFNTSNATFITTQVFPFALRSTATAGLGSALLNMGGANGGFSYSVTAASAGITVTNNGGASGSFYVTFDITGSV